MVGENQFDGESLELKKWETISRTQIKQWSMVAIRDSSNCSVFPPINHENLHHLPTSPSLSSSSSSSLSSFSPSDSDDSGPLSPRKPDAHVSKRGESRSWLGFGFGFGLINRSRVLGIGKVLSFGCGASVVAVVFMLWSFYLRVRQRRCRKRCDLIIKEKDEKINKLLHQIAQMNEVLVARHRVLASKVGS